MTYTLITGASSGIGLALAKEFANHGHNLILVARNKDKLEKGKEQLKRENKVQVEVYKADLSVEKERLELYDYTKSNHLQVEILVNNAGFGDANAYLDATWERQKNMVDVNVVALMHLSYLYAAEMKKRGKGKIMNVSSAAAFSAGPYMSIYYATKAFVLSLSQAMYEELKGDGIIVTALCPGPTITEFEKNANMVNTKMFTMFGASTPEKVARCGYHGLMKGKAVIYHGKITWGYNFISRFCTRKFARKMAQRMDETN